MELFIISSSREGEHMYIDYENEEKRVAVSIDRTPDGRIIVDDYSDIKWGGPE